MNKRELLRFIKRIVCNADEQDVRDRLWQLKDILLPTADASLLALIDVAIKDYPEVKSAAESGSLTAESMEIAHERAAARRQQEAWMRQFGRC